ncbi:MAG: VOC family protein [Burkholderiales bacterium]|jgi:predicted 3-demethylubiquinone-9 3-methyltransferase (glyoxalase superfamily)|nr:VOC family protein [Burkholderiales bacterium]
MQIQQKLTPFIWYQSGAEDAVAHYLKVFGPDKGRVIHTQRWGENSPGAAGTVMVVQFELLGQQLTAFNGGPHFKLDEAFSLMVACEDQAEIDRLWEQLPANGGKPSECGWVKDAWGLSWQIIPAAWFDMIRDPDPARVQRVFHAIWRMQKIDLAALQRAYDGN